MRPKMTAHIGEVPVTDGFEFGFAVAKGVNGFEPIGLHGFAPWTMPARDQAFWPHAFGVEAIGRVAGNFSDVNGTVESLEPIEHGIDLKEIVLGIVELEADSLEFDFGTNAIFEKTER